MFGSLVVILPTPHKGGELILKEGDQSYTFDGTKTLESSTQESPQIAWIAFYSDAFHEVLPVESGARVTLTYNLYFDQVPSLLSSPNTSIKYDTVKSALQQLIDDRTILPKGGRLCFSLSHQYSLKRDAWQDSQVQGYVFEELHKYLKGGDAILVSALQELGLCPALHVLYRNKNQFFEFQPDEYLCDNPIWDEKLEMDNLENLYEDGEPIKNDVAGEEIKRDMFWITLKEDTLKNAVTTYYLFYGNEHSLDYIYGTACVIVELDRE
jgi:hypothetical protein